MNPLLSIRELVLETPAGARGRRMLVDHLSFSVTEGESLALVGESGSGKSITALAIMGLLPEPAVTVGVGCIELGGADLLALSRRERRATTGRDVAMIFQEPMTSLNPVMRIGDQIVEMIRAHEAVGRRAARARAAELLAAVRMPEPAARLRAYPHQLSGGQRQRTMIAIAIALACRPKLLIADEPTTALDVTVQTHILSLLRELQAESGMGMLFITHDLGVVANVADRVAVIYCGQLAESAPVHDPLPPALASLYPRPARLHPGAHPARSYPGLHSRAIAVTHGPPERLPLRPEMSPRGRGLRTGSPPGRAHCRGTYGPLPSSRPDGAPCAGARGPPSMSESRLLEVDALTVRYALPASRLFGARRSFAAVDGVSLALARGESLGLVGETGCGKSSLSRAIYGLAPIAAGSVRFDGVDPATATGAQRLAIRRGMHMIFQDPGGSLNPMMSVRELVAEPLAIHRLGTRRSRGKRVAEVLRSVGRAPSDAERYPHELGGGQRQRIAIARSVVLEPALIIADEPVSALDVSLRAQILNLIAALRRELGLALLFISHDLATVGHLCDRIAVMYLGRIVESGRAGTVLASPSHPYTRELVASSPLPDPRRPIHSRAPAGDPPNPAAPPAGCRYHPRCMHATAICFSESPGLEGVGEDRHVACHHASRIMAVPGEPS